MFKLIVCASAFAAAGLAFQASGSIGGQVLDPAEEPLNGVSLVLTPANSAARPLTFVTETRGLFLFENLPPGRYLLFAERDGFARQAYGSRGNPLTGATIALAAGQEMNDLEFKLTPGAAISGKVLGENGKPVERAVVLALQPIYERGKREYIPLSATNSDSSGEYHLTNLSAGQYLIAAAPRDEDSDAADPTPASLAERRYVTTFYPGAASLRGAAAVSITAGAELTGKDISLTKTATYRVEGKLAQAAPNAAIAWLTPKGSGATGLAMRTAARIRPDGSFRFGGVAAGSYILSATEKDGVTTAAAPMTVNVTARGVASVTLQPSGRAELRGVVSMGAGGASLPKDLQVVLEPADAFESKPPRTTVSADGKFAFKNLPAGRYMARVVAPDVLYVRNVKYGGADVTESAFEVGSAPPPLNVSLSVSGAQVDGIVRGADGNPIAGAVVALVPAIRKFSQFKEGATDQNGAFQFLGVAPGEYRAYAWDDIASGEFQDPEFLKPYENKGQQLALKSNQHETLVLKVIR